jgi:DNA repair protein RadC
MKRPSLSSPPVVADYARTLIGGREYEAFLVFYLDTRNRLIAHEILHEGTVDQAAVYPRNVVRNALDKNASSVIAVHNHPSGDCTPSSHDIGLTRNLKQAVTAVGLRMLDHLIVSRGGHLSFSEQGLL